MAFVSAPKAPNTHFNQRLVIVGTQGVKVSSSSHWLIFPVLRLVASTGTGAGQCYGNWLVEI